jgi:hypothetical protein
MRPVRQSEHSINGSWFSHVHVPEYTSNVAHDPSVRRQVKIKVDVIVFGAGASYLRRRELCALIIPVLEVRLHIHAISEAGHDEQGSRNQLNAAWAVEDGSLVWNDMAISCYSCADSHDRRLVDAPASHGIVAASPENSPYETSYDTSNSGQNATLVEECPSATAPAGHPHPVHGHGTRRE